MEIFFVVSNNINFDSEEPSVGQSTTHFSREEAQQKQDELEAEFNQDKDRGDAVYDVNVAVYKLRDIALIGKVRYSSDENGMSVYCDGEGLELLKDYTLVG